MKSDDNECRLSDEELYKIALEVVDAMRRPNLRVYGPRDDELFNASMKSFTSKWISYYRERQKNAPFDKEKLSDRARPVQTAVTD